MYSHDGRQKNIPSWIRLAMHSGLGVGDVDTAAWITSPRRLFFHVWKEGLRRSSGRVVV